MHLFACHLTKSLNFPNGCVGQRVPLFGILDFRVVVLIHLNGPAKDVSSADYQWRGTGKCLLYWKGDSVTWNMAPTFAQSPCISK